MKRIIGWGPLFALALIACDEGPAGVEGGSQAAVGFSLAPAASQSAAASADIIITGSNGILTISGVAFVVDELKLERVEGSCDDVAEEENGDCENFESGPFFVKLPLTGATIPVVTQLIPAGTYTRLKFETKNLDFDEAGEDEDEDDGDLADVLADIHAAGFADWPEDASLVVAGTFTPTGGEAVSYTVYLDAEVKIEKSFDQPLVIEGEDGTIDVEIDPSMWLLNPDGSVLDLSAFDFATVGEVLKFEAKFENGFTKIELEGFDD